MFGTRKLMHAAIDFHSNKKNTMEVNGYNRPSYLVTKILHSIFFCVQQKKDIYTGLEQLGLINDDIIFISG